MTGMSNFTADEYLNDVTGFAPVKVSSESRFLALFTAVGTDAGTGFTEVSASGTAYARVQVAGASPAASAFTTSSTTITMGGSAPSWFVNGMSVYDNTTGSYVGTASTWVSTTVTLSSTSAINSSGSTDSLQFSAFSTASGTAPGTVTTIAAQTFATATGSGFGTVIAWGIYDASTGGNLLFWDFLGNFQWLPFESTSVNTGNGPVFTSKANGYSNLDPIVSTVEYGGTFPTLTTGTLTGYTVAFAANVATDSYTLTVTSGATAFAATSTGSGLSRKIVQQAIAAGIATSFPSGNFNMSLA